MRETTIKFRPTRLVVFAALVAAGPDVGALATAQVPEGSAVVATYYAPNASGTPGLFLVPLAGGPMTPVTGLPADLRYTGTGGTGPHGAASVSYRSADGAILVGTQTTVNGPTQGDVHLHVLYLNGAAVDPARSRQILLGTTGNAGGAWNAVMPDGRILVVAGQLGGPLWTGPMAGSQIAIVDASGPNPVFTLLPNPTSGGSGGGIAVDPTGQYAYAPVTLNLNTPPRTATLQRMDLTTGQLCQIASWPDQVVFGVTCDDDGTVYVSATNPIPPVTHYVHAVPTNGCTPAAGSTTQSSLALLPAGLDLDRASGRFAAASGTGRPGYSGPQLNALSLIDPATGAVTVVASPPPGGWGVMGVQAVAVNNAIEGYGTASPGQNRYWFDNFPNPGGLPTVGNLGFSLTLASAPGRAATSALLLSSGRGSLSLLGIEILVDLGSSALLFVPTGTSVPHALPIPNSPGLSGLLLTAQSLHLEAGNGVAASRGLTFTVQ